MFYVCNNFHLLYLIQKYFWPKTPLDHGNIPVTSHQLTFYFEANDRVKKIPNLYKHGKNIFSIDADYKNIDENFSIILCMVYVHDKKLEQKLIANSKSFMETLLVTYLRN